MPSNPYLQVMGHSARLTPINHQESKSERRTLFSQSRNSLVSSETFVGHNRIKDELLARNSTDPVNGYSEESQVGV
jgi:hypothetical protein